MKFVEDGPSIPDELLTARDEGRLVVFCGAGVSLARAGMPDFISLADTIANKLGVMPDDPIRSVISEIKGIAKRTGVNGLISADIVFDRLEQSFDRNIIDKAVAESLKPKDEVDLSAHKLLIDLARTPTGNVRIVTSNFELLFEQSDSTLKTYSPLNLPDLNRHDDFSGVVHNHGIVNSDYSGPAGEGFILSSSEFGKAYLADGWATKFIRSVLNKYVLLFVGYAADDPPVKYLLQGLNRLGDNKNIIYAFHPGSTGEADESWSTKGVKAIAYDTPGGSHHYLWDTIEAWRNRAVDIDKWYEDMFLLAENGPESLTPYQRGQIAHIVSTRAGAKKLAQREKPIPASWLCVFDSNIRFSNPGYHAQDCSDDGEWVDPFELYCLDEDDKPPKSNPKDRNTNRKIPKNSWDAFYVSDKELVGKSKNLTSQVRGFYSVKPAPLPERLFFLGSWFERLANDPTLLWWSGRQLGIHPELQDRIRRAIDGKSLEIDAGLRAGWEYLFEVWSDVRAPYHDLSWYDIKSTIDKHGWSQAVVRHLLKALTPRLELSGSFRNIVPPQGYGGKLSQLFSLEIKCLEHVDDIEIDPKYLPKLIDGLAAHIELADELNSDIGGYGIRQSESIRSIIEKGSLERNYYGIGLLIDMLVLNFFTLVDAAPVLAKNMVYSWLYNDLYIFIRLIIWAVGNDRLFNDEEAVKIILEMRSEGFWNVDNQDDLLHSLADRWSCFSSCQTHQLEQKLLAGPDSFDGETITSFQGRKAWRILERIVWLSKNECGLSFNLDEEKKRLIDHCPEWKDEIAINAARSRSSTVRSGFVRTKTDFDDLLRTPLMSVIDEAKSRMGRSDDFFVENDPFSGLVEHHPIMAYRSLVARAKQGEYPEWAWTRFLRHDFRKDDPVRLILCIAYRLEQIPTETFSKLIHQISSWIDTFEKSLFDHSSQFFYRLFDRHLESFRFDITTAGSGIGGSPEPDWISKAINSPIGNLTSALLSDPNVHNLNPKSGFPTYWLERIEQLFALDINYACFSYVILARNIRWFFNIDPDWTQKNVLSHLNDEIIGDAIWSGILWNSNMPQTELFLVIKDDLISVIRGGKTNKRQNVQSLAALLLAGWIREEDQRARIISNEEVREILLEVDDEFRSQVIWMFERWLLGEDNKPDKVMADSASEFFGIVWPKHIKAKSAEISARLFDFAILAIDKIDGVVDLVIPLIQLNENARVRSSEFLHINDDSLVMKYPIDFLRLMYAMLSENALNWPYGIDRALPKLIEAEPSVTKEPMYIELKRRWDSR